MDIYAPPDFLPFDLVLIYLRDCLMFVLAIHGADDGGEQYAFILQTQPWMHVSIRRRSKLRYNNSFSKISN